MKLTTPILKQKILENYPDVDKKSLKRISKKKNSNKDVVRIFSSSIGEIIVITNPLDEDVLDMSMTDTEEKRYSHYYFAVGKEVKQEDDVGLPPLRYVNVVILTKEFWEEKGHLDGDRQEVEDFLYDYNIHSGNESCDFQAMDYPDIFSVIEFLESLGMEYSNDISKFSNENEERVADYGIEMYLKP